MSNTTDTEERPPTIARERFERIYGIIRDRICLLGNLDQVDFLKRANLKTYETFEDKLIKFIRRTPGLTSEKPEVVGQIMATPAFTARDDMHIVDLVPLLSDHGLHHVPIVNAERRLVGMVTQSDLIAALYAGGTKQG